MALLGLSVAGCKRKEPAPPPAPAPTPTPVPQPKPKPPEKPALPPKPPGPALMKFQLPTTNRGLLENNNASFFMYVKRATVSGDVKVWQAGQYGFVRDPKMLKDGNIVYTRFHEGIDVAPMIRDLRGEPEDEVGAIADGTVVYANTHGGKGSYGNYVVIEHATEDGPFYSLSAHFREVKVPRGAKVKRGDIIGIMGYTGTGIDRERSHTHVELNMMLNPKVAPWNRAPEPPAPKPALKPTPTGKPTPAGKPAAKVVAPAAPVINGQNLVGLDVGTWLRTHYQKPETRLADFIRKEPAYFKLQVPCRGTELEIVKRYPWLRAPGPMGLAWEISVGASSLPLKVAPLAEKVDFPVVSWVQPFVGNHAWKSRDMLQGSGTIATLSPHGLAWLKLILEG
jgi:murein DD-endopeptidase MepM/ murein hydrolase activator NlpD